MSARACEHFGGLLTPGSCGISFCSSYKKTHVDGRMKPSAAEAATTSEIEGGPGLGQGPGS